jgi:hypothetical protein
MHTLSQHFNRLLQNISPPDSRIQKAETIPHDIRSFLKEHDGIKTIDPHSRLTGSYSRKTFVGDIKDVDVIIFVDKEYNEKTPDSILRSLKKVLENYDGHGDIDINHQRRSIHMFFKDYDFHLDIVPALMPADIESALMIPDKPKEKWVKTHPLGYGRELSDLNGKKGRKVIPLIRLIKHWRDCQMQYKRPKSYWLECIVFNKMSNGNIDINGKALSEVFAILSEEIYEGYEGHLSEEGKVPWVKDPMLGNNVAGNWERDHFESFMSQLNQTRKWARKALDTEDKEEAIELWQKVFGESYFPVSVEEDAKAMAGILKSGAFASATGQILPVNEANKISTGIQPHRFYGA